MSEKLPQPEQTSYKQQLEEMAKLDQQARQSGDTKKIQEVDQKNQIELALIIKEYGWPTISNVGAEVSHFAWLIAQHADNDQEFQQECLKLMKDLPENEVSLEDIAYLTDRILLNDGKPQLFGTQWKEDPDNGYIPEEIEDPEHLDKRRAEAGMDDFETFSKKMQEFYQEWKK